jgi:hypothetical protein
MTAAEPSQLISDTFFHKCQLVLIATRISDKVLMIRSLFHDIYGYHGGTKNSFTSSYVKNDVAILGATLTTDYQDSPLEDE